MAGALAAPSSSESRPRLHSMLATHAGSSNQNVLPTGTPGSTPMAPPWASMASLQNARPSPTE